MTEKKSLNEEDLNRVSGGDKIAVYFYIQYKLSEDGEVKSKYVGASTIRNQQGSSNYEKVINYCNSQGWIFVSYKEI